MSTQVPEDMIQTVKNLENEASRCLSRGNYGLAQRIYDAIFISLLERQYIEERRIHLGSPLHMKGLSLLLQNDYSSGLNSLLLAYITDVVGTPFGKEHEADKLPAHTVLLTFFGIKEETFDEIKTMIREIKDRSQPFNPNLILDKYLCLKGIPKEKIQILATRKPTPEQLRSIRPRYYEFVTIEAGNRIGQTNRNRLSSILNNLLVNPELVKYLPKVLTEQQVHILSVLWEKYFILAFFNDAEWVKIRDYREKGLKPPLPKLIASNGKEKACAFVIENVRNFLFNSNQVKNIYSFSVGKDSTALILNHKQSIKSTELTTEYTIGLAYLVSFGEEINSNNLYDYLEDLTAYSFKVWRSEFG